MGGDKHDMTYYFKCMVGGVLACGLTHTAVVPLDIVKCRNQVTKGLYNSLLDGIVKINKSEGLKGLTYGWLPTLYGYSMQGFGKFGFYEIFKDLYVKIVGVENAYKYQTIGYAVSSACAEVIADCFLCPMEAVKVKIQTANPPGSYPVQFSQAFGKLKAEEGVAGMYKGLGPLWGRQVPYTIAKFVFFQKTVDAFYNNIFTKPKETYSKALQLSITFMSGYIAGVLCAVVSHPADTLVSKVYASKSNEPFFTQASKIYADIGFMGLWRGLGARIVMVGTLTGLQWWIYDTFKTATGLQTTAGFKKA